MEFYKYGKTKEMKSCYLYNLASSFQTVANRQIFAGNLINAQTLRKEKFPRQFFPEVKILSKNLFS
jgi:hypothetical protein